MSLLSIFRPVVEMFPRVAAAYRGLRDQLDIMEKPRPTPWGFMLAGNKVMADGNFEPAETGLIRTLLNDRDALINIGANIGYYCCHAKSLGKHVVAFEPIHRNMQLLCRNMRLNGWDDVEILPIALSDQVGIVEMYGSDTGASMLKGWAGIPETQRTCVPTSTLDVILQNRLSGKKLLILVDVEGAEYLMLQGAANVINMRPRPIWVVEIALHENQPKSVGINPKFKDTFDLFFQAGYHVKTADENMRPITSVDIELALIGKKDLGVHNFIFLHSKGE